MTKDQKIAKLTGLYYRMIVIDHHKDKDCHFYIQAKWSYGNKAQYSVIHNGYVNEFEETVSDFEEAQDILIEKITELVKGEVDQWKTATPDDAGWGPSSEDIKVGRTRGLDVEMELVQLSTDS